MTHGKECGLTILVEICTRLLFARLFLISQLVSVGAEGERGKGNNQGTKTSSILYIGK